MNCAVCHVGTVKITEGADPQKIYGTEPSYVTSQKQRVIIPGMPANSVELIAYFQFLFACAADGDYTPNNVMAHINSKTKLGPVDKLFYRRAVPVVRQFLLLRKKQLAYAYENPPDGPGRVDTFNPYKSIVFGFPADHSLGASDFPSIWNQRPREGMQLHWDGNNTSVFNRNISASLGAGATPVSLDMSRMLRTAAWIGAPDPHRPPSESAVMQERLNPVPHVGEMQIPKYPFPIDEDLATRGAPIYEKYCASCHSFTGKHVGKVVPYEQIDTDRHRLDSYTQALSDNQNTLGAGTWWRFRYFRKTDGYANAPLDGIWARAPYLHNGSVPTLRDLLNVDAERPQVFYRGDDEYDPINVGFRTDRAVTDEGKKLFKFDTTCAPNGNSGHYFGTKLTDDEKTWLVEYMKKL
jgi:mono/diheme cytochrome c family protein